MVDPTLITSYIPIQELNELEPINPNPIVDLSANDLFLISKISALADSEHDAVAVSQKLRYVNLRNKVSSDFSIQSMKNNINTNKNNIITLSTNLNHVSSDVYTKISSNVTTLSTKVNTLSTKVEAISNDLTGYQKQIHRNSISTIRETEATFDLASQIEILSTGNLNVKAWKPVDEIIKLDEKTIAAGIINGEKFKNQTINIASGKLTYETENYCYLNITLSIDEAYCKPINVSISAENVSKQTIAKFDHPFSLNTQYVNTYSLNVPCKPHVKIIAEYADGSNLTGSSMMQIIEYKFFGAPTEAELETYVKKPEEIASLAHSLGAYKIQTNDDGLVISAESLPLATTDVSGLIKLKADDTASRKYGLTCESNGQGYVQVPQATTDTYGLVKLRVDDTASRIYGLKLSANGQGYVQVPQATASTHGTIKLGTDVAASRIYGLKLNASGQGYVQIPTASSTTYGLVKASNESLPSKGTNTNESVPVHIDNATGMLKSFAQPFSIANITEINNLNSVTDFCLSPNANNIIGNKITYSNLSAQLLNNLSASIIDNSLNKIFRDALQYKIGATKINLLDKNVPITNSTLNEYDILPLSAWYLTDGATPTNIANITISNFRCYYTETNITKPFLASLVYQHNGAISTASANDVITIICDGIAIFSFKPQSIASNIGNQAYLFQFLGYFSGRGGLNAATYNPGQNGLSTTKDKLYLLIKTLT